MSDDLRRLRSYLDDARRNDRQRLPSEARLAEEVGVTRSRLRSLLKQLESEGLVWRHVGKGTFVGERTMTANLGDLAGMLSPQDAFEARLVLEPQLAAMAARRASPREIDEMRLCLEKMAGITAFEEWAVWDERLHRLVAKAAHNELLLALYDTVRQCAPSGMRTRIRTVFSGSPRAETNHEHEAWFAAIAARDPQRAEHLMREHLHSIRQTLFGPT